MDWNIQNANSIHFFGDRVLLQDTAPYRSMAGFAKFPDAALPSNTTITVYAVQDLKIFLIPSLRF